MKKLFIVSIIALVSLVSCTKKEFIELESEDPKQEMKLNVTVSVESETKAVKTSWVEGDLINVFFFENGTTQLTDAKMVVLEYNSSINNWQVMPKYKLTFDSITEEGNISAFYMQGEERMPFLDGESSIATYPSIFFQGGTFFNEVMTINQLTAYTISENTIHLHIVFQQVGSQITITNLEDPAEGGYDWHLLSNLGDNNMVFNGIIYAGTSRDNVYLSQVKGLTIGTKRDDGWFFYGIVENSDKPIVLLITCFDHTYVKEFDPSLRIGMKQAVKITGPTKDNPNGWKYYSREDYGQKLHDMIYSQSGN